MWLFCFSAPISFFGSEGKLALFGFFVGTDASGGADFLFGTDCFSVVGFGTGTCFGTECAFDTEGSKAEVFVESRCFLAEWPGCGTECFGTEASLIVFGACTCVAFTVLVGPLSWTFCGLARGCPEAFCRCKPCPAGGGCSTLISSSSDV